ncbi:MAG: AMP-binding protein [Chloroflexi bacterium]|nr:AMP-binding protein [Chloroflexota bacterium]
MAIMLPNCPQFIIAINAVWRLGAIAVCAEGRYASRHLEEILLDSGSKTIITTEKSTGAFGRPATAVTLERLIYTDIEAYLPWQTRRVSLGTSPLTQLFRPQESLSTIPFDKVSYKNIATLKLIEVSTHGYGRFALQPFSGQPAGRGAAYPS